MEAVIVSKTQMNHHMCVGAILQDGTGIRLLDAFGQNQPENTLFEIGQIWDLVFTNRPNTRDPHNEDVYVHYATLKSGPITDLRSYLLNKIKVKVWQDSSDNLFEGEVGWTGNGSGYVCERIGTPDHSVGFFICKNDLEYDDDKHYIIPSLNPFLHSRRLAYVGRVPAIPIIKAGTLVRISLARWWKPEDVDIEERCYIQVSGWY